MTEEIKNQNIKPESIYLEENIQKDILSKLNIKPHGGFGCRYGRLDITFLKFPKIIAITGWEQDSSGYDRLYAGTWQKPHYLDMLSLDLKKFEQFEYLITHTELPRDRRFNTAINSYEEKAGQITQRDNYLVIPVIQKWFIPKDSKGTAWGNEGWLHESLDRTEIKEIKFRIPENLIDKTKA